MIRYPAGTRVIERLVQKRQPGWQAEALERTRFHQAAGHYIKKTEILPNGRKADEFWGEVKSIFVTVQFGKCAYCEAISEASKIQWDLEHFRPKDRVDAWPLNTATGPTMLQGYYLLAYNLGNYVASCKTCNTMYKRNYFPIAHHRIIHGQTIAAHLPEGAYLIYPLGDQAEDPEEHIEFLGARAVAKNTSARGQLIIDFFDLNREELEKSRAQWLVHTFWNAYEGFLADRPRAVKTMTWLLSHKAPFTNCTRCFLELCLHDQPEADRQYEIMLRMLRKSPRI